MRKIFACVLLVSLIAVMVPTAAFAAGSTTVNLIAGQHTTVGTVTVTDDGANLTVTYQITEPGWAITQTHLAVGCSIDDIPQTKKGNPKVGHFEYKTDHNPPVSTFTYNASVPAGCSGKVAIAAHAVVERGLAGLALTLPDYVFISVVNPGGDSYFDVTISGSSSSLLTNGLYDGWCVDTDKVIYQGWTYIADVFSSYDPEANQFVEYPENWDLVNFILNRHWVGQESPSGGTYTYGDVQRAIWELIENDPNAGTNLGAWTPTHVGEIKSDAIAHGNDFVPGCGELVAVTLVPFVYKDGVRGESRQIIIVPVPAPCSGSETAWAGNQEFPGRSWALYFEYNTSP